LRIERIGTHRGADSHCLRQRLEPQLPGFMT
jgi:hypothetical protein